jgi:hypothetical protein
MKILMQAADTNPGQGAGAPAGAAAPAAADKSTPAAAGGAAGAADASKPQAGTQQQAPQDKQPPEPAKGADVDKTKPAAVAQLAIKLPDGVQADQKLLDGYVGAATKLGLSQEQAQGISDFFLAAQTEQAKGWDGALKAAIAKDEATLRADKDWGGANYDATTKAAESAEKQFFSEGWQKFLRELGAHNHPEYRKGLAFLRSLIAEDSVGDKRTAPGVDNSRSAELKRMFPNSPQMFEQGS